MTMNDDRFEWSDAQNIASGTLSSGSSVVSEDVTDLEATQQDGFFATVTTTRIGEQAKSPVLLVSVSTAFTGAAAAVDVKITSKAASATLTTGGTTHATKQIAALAAIGDSIEIPLPKDAYNRYIGIVYTANGGNLTAGAVNANIVESGQLID